MSKVSIYYCDVHERIPDNTKRNGFRHKIISNCFTLLARSWDEVIEIVEFECIGGGFTYDKTHEWDMNNSLDRATLILDDKRYSIIRRPVDLLSYPQQLGFQYNDRNYDWKKKGD